MPGPATTTDPIVIERHCTCRRDTVGMRDAAGYPAEIRQGVDVHGCPLHDPDPKYDLPKGTF